MPETLAEEYTRNCSLFSVLQTMARMFSLF